MRHRIDVTFLLTMLIFWIYIGKYDSAVKANGRTTQCEGGEDK